jgi:predicted HAD superfamily phosphohydrolase YqeG
VLEISSGIRGPAEFVISNISQEDIDQAGNRLGLSSISSTGYRRKPLSEELQKALNQLKKYTT